MRQMPLVRLLDEVALRVEIGRGSLERRLLSRLRMEIWRRALVDDSSLLRSDLRTSLRRSLFLVRSEHSDAVLWQLNHGSYGTFDFFFVVDSVVRLAVMIVR